MTFKETFSNDEKQLLTTLPNLIGTAVAFSESSGILGTMKEMFASGKTVIGGVKTYPNNSIISGVLPSLEDRNEAWQKSKELRVALQDKLKTQNITSKEQFNTMLLSDCKKVNELLKQKSSHEEASEYKKWALNVAEVVAKSSKEGGFLGFGGTRISDGEKHLIGEISNHLETPNPLMPKTS